MAERRDPADHVARELVSFARRGPPDVEPPEDRAEPRQVDPVRTGHQDHDGLQLAVIPRQDEDERLHDLPELRPDGARRLGRGVGGLVEGDDPEVDALPRGRVDHAPDGGVLWGRGHRRRVYRLD